MSKAKLFTPVYSSTLFQFNEGHFVSLAGDLKSSPLGGRMKLGKCGQAQQPLEEVSQMLAATGSSS